MKTMTQSKTGEACSILTVMSLLMITTNAEARVPHARDAAGVVQTINQDKRTLTLDYPQGHGPREAVWNSDTTFLRNGKSATAAELKESAHATIYYKSPFFGKPFATKVVWNDKSESEIENEKGN
jgi:hypothetical protein